MSSQGQRLTPLEMLARLVSFDTESSKSNLPLIDFVEELSAELERALHPRAERRPATRRRIYATIGPQDRGGDRALRPYGRGAGDRSGLDVRSLHAAGRRTGAPTGAARST